MSIKVGMNGFGRICRAVLRIAQERFDENVDLVDINARTTS